MTMPTSILPSATVTTGTKPNDNRQSYCATFDIATPVT